MIRLNMNRDSIGSRFNKSIQILVRSRHHKMHVESDPGAGTHGGDKLRAKRDILHKMTIHHVKVEPVRPGTLGFLHFLPDS